MIDQNTYNQLMAQGYTPEQIQQATMEMQPQMQMAPYPAFAPNPNENIVQWQLDLEAEKERIFHLLRGDAIEDDKNGNKVWVKKEKKGILNDYGVDEVMRILDFFLNKNTILSDYNEKEINIRVYDFGVKLSNLIFMKYDKIGLEKKNYDILTHLLITTVESAYRRALHGGERRSLREARQITQTEQLENQQMMPMMSGRPRGVLNPARYLFGKFKY